MGDAATGLQGTSPALGICRHGVTGKHQGPSWDTENTAVPLVYVDVK